MSTEDDFLDDISDAIAKNPNNRGAKEEAVRKVYLKYGRTIGKVTPYGENDFTVDGIDTY
jgi:hypothetical protein